MLGAGALLVARPSSPPKVMVDADATLITAESPPKPIPTTGPQGVEPLDAGRSAPARGPGARTRRRRTRPSRSPASTPTRGSRRRACRPARSGLRSSHARLLSRARACAGSISARAKSCTTRRFPSARRWARSMTTVCSSRRCRWRTRSSSRMRRRRHARWQCRAACVAHPWLCVAAQSRARLRRSRQAGRRGPGRDHVRPLI